MADENTKQDWMKDKIEVQFSWQSGDGSEMAIMWKNKVFTVVICFELEAVHDILSQSLEEIWASD